MNMPRLKLPLALLLALLMGVLSASTGLTASFAVGFEVTANDGRAMVLWKTGAEPDYVGFNIYRAPTPTGPWLKVNGALIAPTGNALSGAFYTLADTPGRGLFYYQLEVVDLFGNNVLHQPVMAQLGPATHTPTYLVGVLEWK